MKTMREYAVIVAADMPSPEATLGLVQKVASKVDGVKIGVATVLVAGASILKRIAAEIEGKPLLLDLKIADIGFKSGDSWQGTNAKIIESLSNSGVTHVTVHGFPGPLSLAESVAVSGSLGIGVLTLPHMSHQGGGLFFNGVIDPASMNKDLSSLGASHWKADTSTLQVSDAILMLGERLGVDGYIGPATRPEVLQRYRMLTKKRVWCPGFGRQDRLGRSLEKQFSQWAELLGPQAAAIVGSAIFRAEDPRQAAQEITAIRDRVVEQQLGAKSTESSGEAPHLAP